MRGAYRDRHGSRGGMRWTRSMFDRRRTEWFRRFAGEGVTCVGDDDHIGADGPSRGIPAHRPCAMGQRQRHLLVQRDGRGVEVPCSGGSTQGSNIGGVAEQAVNTIACGTPDASGAFVATTLVCLLLLHTGLRTHRASGVPRALSIRGRDVHRTTRAQSRREIAKPYPIAAAV